MSDAVQTEVQPETQNVSEESSWEVGTESEFQTESEASTDEDSGDEVLRYRHRKRAAVS